MPESLESRYNHQKTEEEIYKRWEESGHFNPDKLPGERKGVFSMVLPPPNVTGILHIGHALMLTVEDIMVRYHRMRGDKTLWIPGTDHAAIATQEKVERDLYKKEKKTRHDLGRDVFLRRVEEFAKENHDNIVRQIKKMGASLDWSREAYTLDEARSRAVTEAFVQMYNAGIIYRGARIVNWDPKLQTTVSDDEVVWTEEQAPFYYLQYGPFVIATARPETKFGDKYVVMHPEDKRYADYKNGQRIDLEWINGKITATIIKDEAVDPEFGTGVMTITPWHDAADFDIAERHKLEKEQIIDTRGKLLPIAGEFASMHITKARPLIVLKLKEKGLLVKVDESYTHRVATNSRGNGKIEPQILKQWFVDVNKSFKNQGSGIKGIERGQTTSLKEIMITVVKSGQIKIIPEHFEKTYFHWINNLRDWCISRQLWYGHRIPAWYCLACNMPKVGVEARATWFLMRHGETDWNKDGRGQGQSDIPLNEAGIEQARQAARQLKSKNIDLIISSDLQRAKTTAEIIAQETGAELIFERDLRERHYGKAEGLSRDDIKKQYKDFYSYEGRPADNESYKEVENRLWQIFDEHKNKHGHKNVVIVSHGGSLRMLLKRIKNENVEEAFSRITVPNASPIPVDILDACKNCGSDLYEQDPDTLDTWFSSGLWTFSTLGWPSTDAQTKKNLETYHPTTVLETGYDILFFWVARMILMTGFFLGDIPFKTVYLHGLVRDKDRQKMSKSKGNAIDPLGVAEIYGTDAVRMALVVGTAPGNDPIVSEDKIRGYRNFTTKLWNIARFILAAKQEGEGATPPLGAKDQAIIDECAAMKKEITKHIESYEFHLAAEKLYHYVWHTFADKIVEEAKLRLRGENRDEQAAAYSMLTTVFSECLTMLHPFMPFITEELYQKFHPEALLMIKKW